MSSPELLTRSRPRAPRLLSGWLACELELSKYREREGVFTRLSVVLKAKQMAPAAWWSQYGKHLRPTAPPSSRASRARCLRSHRLRASAAERNWSISGKIKPKVSPRSARSSGATPRPTSLEARLLLDKAQGAGRRLQGARVEKWDSDSDSDKSDDEAGLMV